MVCSQKVLIIFGSPCSGKSTLTNALSESSRNFVPVKLLRDYSKDPLNDSQYEVCQPSQFDEALEQGELQHWHVRYDRRYGLRRKAIEDVHDAGLIPVVQIGRYLHVLSLFASLDKEIQAFMVRLDLSRENFIGRLQKRHLTLDDPAVESRIEAYEEEVAEYYCVGPKRVTFELNTGNLSLEECKNTILDAVLSKK
jgi:guanylate kinase